MISNTFFDKFRKVIVPMYFVTYILRKLHELFIFYLIYPVSSKISCRSNRFTGRWKINNRLSFISFAVTLEPQ